MCIQVEESKFKFVEEKKRFSGIVRKIMKLLLEQGLNLDGAYEKALQKIKEEDKRPRFDGSTPKSSQEKQRTVDNKEKYNLTGITHASP